ncbi:MAG TPA: ATP-binding protein [Crocinitomicaceae bacterium]|nr:ATP-binding protein [Crocinitomicaceae bacterium]
MEFYGRQNEQNTLMEIERKSSENAQFTMLIGRRRIGKTTLLLETFKGKKVLYFFVSRNSERVLCQQFQELAEKEIGLKIYGTISSFSDLFGFLLDYAKSQQYTLIIDEFQEFDRINPAIYSDIQKQWDLNKDKIRLNLIVCGSVYSLMTKIFENRKEPLFGRLTAKINLKPFTVATVKQILNDYNSNYSGEDLLCLYLLSGGVPQYISLLMNAKATTKRKMLATVFQTGSPFLTEGKDILISEFGRDYATYFAILQLISQGKTRQSEIDSIIDKNTGAYLQNLELDFSVITKKKPLFSKPNSRNSVWEIEDNFLRFWFRFIASNQSLLETGRFDRIFEILERDYSQYSGLVLERYFLQKYREEETVTIVGQFWDRKSENEIDLIALDELNKTAVIAEVKMNKTKINLNVLQQKATVIAKELQNYNCDYIGLSLEDM